VCSVVGVVRGAGNYIAPDCAVVVVVWWTMTTAPKRRGSVYYGSDPTRSLGDKLSHLLSVIMGRMKEKTGSQAFEPTLADLVPRGKTKVRRGTGAGAAAMLAAARGAVQHASKSGAGGEKGARARRKAASLLKRTLLS